MKKEITVLGFAQTKADIDTGAFKPDNGGGAQEGGIVAYNDAGSRNYKPHGTGTSPSF